MEGIRLVLLHSFPSKTIGKLWSQRAVLLQFSCSRFVHDSVLAKRDRAVFLRLTHLAGVLSLAYIVLPSMTSIKVAAAFVNDRRPQSA